MTDFSRASSDTLNDIIFGRADGFQFVSVAGESGEIGPAFQNLTGLGGLQILPVGAEALEILSTSTDDALTGTGAQTVLVRTLDENYVEQETVAEMDGITPVDLPGTHLRLSLAIVLTAGADVSNTNLGDIKIQVQGGGIGRTVIKAGVGICRDLIFTVPAGKTAFMQNVSIFCSKNRDAVLRPRRTPFGGATIEEGLTSTYQNEQASPFPPPLILNEKSDFIVDSNSDNPGTAVLAIYSFVIAENDRLP